METDPLNTHQSRNAYFRRAIKNNVTYWQQEIETHTANGDRLDDKREEVVRAIKFALDLENDLWSSTKQLIEQFSPYMERRARWALWRTILDPAVDVGERIAPDEVSDLSILLARVLFQESQHQEIRYAYRRTIRLARNTGDRYSEARACTNLGYYFVERGLWHRAEVLCCHALQLFEQVDSDHGRAHTENHLGVLYTRREKWNEAEQHLKQACQLWEKMGDTSGLIRGLTNLGVLYEASKRPDNALLYSQNALTLAETLQDQRHIGLLQLNIGVAYQSLDLLENAKTSLLEAERTFRQIKYLYGLALTLHNLGLVFLKQNAWDESGHYLKAGLSVWQKLNYPTYEAQNLLYLAEHDLATNQDAQAIVWLKQAEVLLQQQDQHQKYRPLWNLARKLRLKLKSTDAQGETH